MIRQIYRDLKRLLTHNPLYRHYQRAIAENPSSNYLVQLISSNPKAVGLRLVALLAISIVVYLVRPIFHGIFYSIAYYPSATLSLGIPLLFGIFLFVLPPFENDRLDSFLSKATIFGVVFGLMIVVGIGYAFIGGMVTNESIAQQTMAEGEEVDGLPNVNPDNARVLPKEVSDTQTRGSVSYRTHELGNSDIARMEDGSLAWSYGIEPEGTRNTLVENQRGVVMTDMTTIDNREVQAHDQSQFKYGEGMAFSRHARWHAQMGDYDAAYHDDAVEFTHDGTPYIAYPKTGHEWHLTPIPHTTPTWEGVALVHPDGTTEHLSPEEARQSEILEGQRIYPLYNTRAKMQSLPYRNGIQNQMPVIGSQDYVEVAGLPGDGNTQPFVIDLKGEQMVYVTAMEPQGEDTRGLDEVWFADARTGQHYYYGGGEETLTGPERAMGIVRSSDTQTNWGNNFEVVEPVPVTVDGELWWHAKVVTTDKTDVSRNVFVNAHSGEAVQIQEDSAIREFLAGGSPDEAQQVTTEEAEDQPDVAYYIVVTDQDGNEVDRIPVEEGHETNIVQENNGTASANETAAA